MCILQVEAMSSEKNLRVRVKVFDNSTTIYSQDVEIIQGEGTFVVPAMLSDNEIIVLQVSEVSNNYNFSNIYDFLCVIFLVFWKLIFYALQHTPTLSNCKKKYKYFNHRSTFLEKQMKLNNLGENVMRTYTQCVLIV